jgi:DNA topoisomerase I
MRNIETIDKRAFTGPRFISKQPPRPGLVPQSGDPEHPVRWVRPDRETEGRGLKIPPGWSDVWINEDPQAPLQATGVDSKGRKQYVYSKAHSEKAAAEKFARLKEFDATLPKIRAQVFRDLNHGKDEAAILYLIDKTGFRIGSTRDTKSKAQAFGASTLRGEYVNVDGEVVSFNFIGKKGVRQSKRVVDPVLAAAINERKGEPDQPLFGATDSHVRRYLNQIAGRPFNVKDFRTWHGTNAAREIMSDLPAPQDSREFDRSRRIVGQQVAEILGNTPDMALNSYIAPEVFSEWKAPLAEAGMVRKDLSDLFETISYDSYGDWVNTPETHVDEDEVSEISKQEAPGPPPRPGLQWKPQTHRWIRPQSDTKEEWTIQGDHGSNTVRHLNHEKQQLEDELDEVGNQIEQIKDALENRGRIYSLELDLERLDAYENKLFNRRQAVAENLLNEYKKLDSVEYREKIASIIADEDDHWNQLYAETVTPEEQALIETIPLGVNTLTGGINTTFMLTTEEGGQVFKPKKGEEEGVRQDIPGGSYYIREIAAYRFAELLGLSHLVPVTGYREFKENKGSSQQFIEEAEGLTSSEFEEHESRYDAALFDALIGNTDRHQFNALKDSDGSIKLIDHGLAFPEGVEPSFPRSVFVKAVEGQHLQDHHREMLTWVTDNADEIEHNLTWMLRSKTAAKGVTVRAKAMLDTDSYTGPYEWSN